MPALDSCHPSIIRALQKDGCTLVDSPSRLSTWYRTVYVDAKMARQLNGSRQQIMLVEGKCFPDETSTTRDLYTAIGQYFLYRAMILELGGNDPVYLAIPDTIFETVFDIAVMRVVRDYNVKLVVINLETETVTQWIE